MKGLFKNILAFLLGSLTFFVATIILSILCGFLSKLPLVINLLSWPSSPRLYLSFIINGGATALAFLVADKLSAVSLSGTKGGLRMVAALVILLGGSSIISIFSSSGFDDSLWAMASTVIVAAVVLKNGSIEAL